MNNLNHSSARVAAVMAAAAPLLGGCASQTATPLPIMASVDLQRFMGDWYVIANIPTFLEKDAHNAVESYRIDTDGSIATTFTYRSGGFEGKEKRMTPRGFVRDSPRNAVWGMRFVWPIKADYRIVHVDARYTETIVGRERRDYVWIMARKPQISDADYQRLVAQVAQAGYDVTKLQRVPQRWP
jgi:apolipoprotein D and lipocalin family protein